MRASGTHFHSLRATLSHPWSRRYLLAGILYSLYSTPLFAVAGLFDGGDVAMVKERCAQEGKVTGTSAVSEGLFVAVSSESFQPFSDAARYLLEDRFRYVEYERPRDLQPGRRPPEFVYRLFNDDLLGPETGEKYLRISVAREGDPRCEPFKKYVTSSSIFAAPQLRWWGLPHGMCLAVDRTNELRAPVEYVYVPDTKSIRSGLPERGWYRYQERQSRRVIAQVWTGASRGFSCFDRAELRKLDTFVVSPGNPGLPDLPPITKSERPQFPSRQLAIPVRVGPESPAPPKKYTDGSPRLDYANWTLPGTFMDHGDTSLEARYASSSPAGLGGTAVGISGHELKVVRPGLRRQMSVADGALNYTMCGTLTRLGALIAVSCDARQESEGGEKWTSSNWLLLYDDDGSPREHIQFDLTRGVAAQPEWKRPFFILDKKLLPDGNLQTTVQFQREDRKTYQAEVTFRRVPPE